jgi:hypothetical protein
MRWKAKNLKSSVAKGFAGAALMYCLLTPFSGVYAQDNAGFVVDEIIAKVDNYIVLMSDLDK